MGALMTPEKALLWNVREALREPNRMQILTPTEQPIKI
jgi:hypothetical protein